MFRESTFFLYRKAVENNEEMRGTYCFNRERIVRCIR